MAIATDLIDVNLRLLCTPSEAMGDEGRGVPVGCSPDPTPNPKPSPYPNPSPKPNPKGEGRDVPVGAGGWGCIWR